MFGLLTKKKSSGSTSASIKMHATVSLSAWLLMNDDERKMHFLRLEKLLFLAGWKLALNDPPFDVRCDWQHDRKSVSCHGLRTRLQNQSQFALGGDNQPSKTIVALSRKINNPLPASQAEVLVDYHRFIKERSDSQLSIMCREAFPFRTAPARKTFSLRERAMAYHQSRSNSRGGN